MDLYSESELKPLSYSITAGMLNDFLEFLYLYHNILGLKWFNLDFFVEPIFCQVVRSTQFVHQLVINI